MSYVPMFPIVKKEWPDESTLDGVLAIAKIHHTRADYADAHEWEDKALHMALDAILAHPEATPAVREIAAKALSVREMKYERCYSEIEYRSSPYND